MQGAQHASSLRPTSSHPPLLPPSSVSTETPTLGHEGHVRVTSWQEARHEGRKQGKREAPGDTNTRCAAPITPPRRPLDAPRDTSRVGTSGHEGFQPARTLSQRFTDARMGTQTPAEAKPSFPPPLGAPACVPRAQLHRPQSLTCALDLLRSLERARKCGVPIWTQAGREPGKRPDWTPETLKL